MKKSRLAIIAVLTMMLVAMLIPTGAYAATKTSKISLSKSTVSLLAGNNVNGINPNVQVTWANRILPLGDRVTVTVPYCSVEKTTVSIKVVSNNGKTYTASKTVPKGTKAKVQVTGATAYNTKSIKVVVKGTRLDTGATSTWTVVNK